MDAANPYHHFFVCPVRSARSRELVREQEVGRCQISGGSCVKKGGQGPPGIKSNCFNEKTWLWRTNVNCKLSMDVFLTLIKESSELGKLPRFLTRTHAGAGTSRRQ